ncbi:hypothetical protein AHAS_Ahas06G0282200 [Arachis hypogaea]
MDPKCFIPSLLRSKLVDSFNLASKLSEAIEVVDNVAMEIIRQRRREMAIITTGLNKSNLLSRFMRFIEDDKYLKDINSVIFALRLPGIILSSVRVVKDYFILC